MQKIYKDKSKINQVVDILISKGTDIFYSVEEELITIINEGDFRLRGIEIFNKDRNLVSNLDVLFEDEIKILSGIDGINRAIYILLDPRSQIPPHLDDDDQSYRIVTGVNIRDGSEITVLNNTVSMTTKKSLGFEASKITHSSINYGDFFCTMLIVCLSKNPFDTEELVEIF